MGRLSTFSLFVSFLLRSLKVFRCFNHLTGRSLELLMRTEKLEEEELKREEGS